jgi:5-methylcytosine-specific restriction protein A
MKLFFAAASPEHQKKEKSKARELRQSSWWKQQRGKGVCYHCGGKFSPDEITMDHLIPIARGGTSDKKNCVPCCKECNSKKGHKTRAEMAFDELEKQNSGAEPGRSDSSNSDDSDENSSN